MTEPSPPTATESVRSTCTAESMRSSSSYQVGSRRARAARRRRTTSAARLDRRARESRALSERSEEFGHPVGCQKGDGGDAVPLAAYGPERTRGQNPAGGHADVVGGNDD